MLYPTIGCLYIGLSPVLPDLQSMVVEVKGDKHITIQALRALRGVLAIEVAMMSGLIVMATLGKIQGRSFRNFMSEAGGQVLNGRPNATQIQRI